MTRKRFIKILMACGIQRNRANKLAEHANREHVSYDDAFAAFIAAVSDVIRAFVEEARKIES